MRRARDLRSAFRGKKVFITGHTGFKGAWLSTWLLELGAQVTGFSLPGASDTRLFDELGLAGRLTDLRGDIRELSATSAALEQAKPEMIFHLAAQALVRPSYRDPLATFSTNVAGTAHVLEAVRLLKIPCTIVCVTSDKCYRNDHRPHGYAEDDPLGGHDPYSASKAAAEIVIASYRDSFFPAGGAVRLASARAGNVIGGGDWAQDRIVPDCVRALQAGQPVEVRNPESTRPWQHVLEPLGGYLALAAALHLDLDNQAVASAFNFGPDPEAVRSVRDLVTTLLESWPGEWRDGSALAAPHEAARLHLNIDKAARVLDWKPAWPFDEAVRRTIAWYRRKAEGASAGQLCAEQIAAYQEVMT